MEYIPGQRVKLIKSECWLAARTQANSVGRVDAGELGTVIEAPYGPAVKFDNIRANTGGIFLIGPASDLFQIIEEGTK